MTVPGYVVLTASARMPASCKGRYRRVAVCLVADPKHPPATIALRAKGMLEIVRTWEACNVGQTSRSAYFRARVEAEALRTKLETAAREGML